MCWVVAAVVGCGVVVGGVVVVCVMVLLLGYAGRGPANKAQVLPRRQVQEVF